MPLRSRQLHLSDLVILALLVGVVCGMILPAAMSSQFPSDPGLPYPSVAEPRLPAYIFFAATLGMLAGALPCLLIQGSSRRSSAIERWAFAAVMGALASFFATGVGQFGATMLGIGMSSSAKGRQIYVNEIGACAACKAYVTAQDIYRRLDYNHDGALEYSQTARGKYALGDPDIALIDRAFANAFWGEGAPPVPKNGYIFKILKNPGPRGKMSYLDENGRMTKGFALVAAPAVYGLTGCEIFLISNTGAIFSFDAGEKTPEVFKQMAEFDTTRAMVVEE